jgi:hypothetical protein
MKDLTISIHKLTDISLELGSRCNVRAPTADEWEFLYSCTRMKLFWVGNLMPMLLSVIFLVSRFFGPYIMYRILFPYIFSEVSNVIYVFLTLYVSHCIKMMEWPKKSINVIYAFLHSLSYACRIMDPRILFCSPETNSPEPEGRHTSSTICNKSIPFPCSMI